jgi:hypothetical protein
MGSHHHNLSMEEEEEEEVNIWGSTKKKLVGFT